MKSKTVGLRLYAILIKFLLPFHSLGVMKLACAFQPFAAETVKHRLNLSYNECL